jgi:DNA-binding response OmpR family regulator
MARILLVEDNLELAAGIRFNLELEGDEVRTVEDGGAALDAAREFRPDLVILDLMLPNMDGFQVLHALRGEGLQIPVLILTARGEEADKVRAFRLDADQYLTKPFGLLELLERVKVLLRRASGARTANGDVRSRRLRFGSVEIDVQARRVRRGGTDVPLTPKAFALLLALIEAEGRVVSRQTLLQEVWGHRGKVLTRTVDSHISELRQKLEDDPERPRHIRTVWKAGYRFER